MIEMVKISVVVQYHVLEGDQEYQENTDLYRVS
jgi:hypothetical protein